MVIAEEIMLKNIPNGIQNIKGKGDGKPQYQAEKDIIIKTMIEFAKIHVQDALEKASQVLYSDHVDYDTGNFIFNQKEDVLNSYPLTDIK